MDLLESVLRTANAEGYIETFRKNNIEAATLPFLSDADLQIFGVDKPDVRKSILEKSSALQIPREQKEDLKITREYAELVLHQISHQLHLHYAALSCAINRKDIVVCDVKLQKASECLLNCINSLEGEVNDFEKKNGSPRKQKRRRAKRFIVSIGVTTAVLFILGRLAKNYIVR